MPTRSGSAQWRGDLQNGDGTRDRSVISWWKWGGCTIDTSAALHDVDARDSKPRQLHFGEGQHARQDQRSGGVEQAGRIVASSLSEPGALMRYLPDDSTI